MRTVLASTLLVSLTVAACSGSSGGSSFVPQLSTGLVATGTVDLSGDDTSILGDVLVAGDAGLQIRAGSGDLYSVVFVDAVSEIDGEDFIEPEVVAVSDVVFGDDDNGFLMGIVDDETAGVGAISLSVVVNGRMVGYACSLPALPFVDCGDLTIDRDTNTVTFDDVLLEPVGDVATAPLRLNGAFRWIEQ